MQATCEYCGETFDAKRASARFCSEAHKKAHQRGGKPAENSELLARRVIAYDAALGSADVPSPASEERSAASLVPDSARADGAHLGPRRLAISEEEYVTREVEATKAAIARGLRDHDGKRVARARAYARSRYAGVLDGSVSGL
jgi:hypothetical protein